MPSSQVGQCEEQKYPNWWEQSPGVTPPPPDFNSSIHHCVVTIAGRPGQENRHTHTHTCAHIYKRAPPQIKLPEHMRSFANQLYMQFMRFKQAYTHKHNYFYAPPFSLMIMGPGEGSALLPRYSSITLYMKEMYDSCVEL